MAVNVTNSVDDGEQSLEEYDYDYELDESLSTYDWAELGPSLAVYSVTFALGVVGNALILASVARHTHVKSSPVSVFLASLASADLMLILTCLPLKVAKLFSYTWTFGMAACKLLYYVQTVTVVCSVLNLTALSIERYYAIVHPLKAQYLCTLSRAKKTVLAAWAMAFVLATPILFVQVHLEVGSRHKAFWCVRNIDDPLWWRLHELYLLLAVLVCPTVVMTCSYGSIIVEVRHVVKQREKMTTYFRRPETKKRPEDQAEYEVAHPSVRTANQNGNKSTPKHARQNSELEGKLNHIDAANKNYRKDDSRELGYREQKGVSPSDVSDDGDVAKGKKSKKDKKRLLTVKILSRGPSPTSAEAKQRRSSAAALQKSKSDEETRQIVRMLIGVVLVYIVCWAPLLTFNLLQSFGVIDAYLLGTVKYLKTVFSLMAYFNSCLNPIIYGFTSRNFRQSYLSELRRCCLCCPHPGGHPGGRSRHGGEGNPAGVGMRLLRPPAPAGGGGRNDSLGNTLCVTSAEGYRRGSKTSRISQTSF